MKGLLEKDRRCCIQQGPTIIIAIVLLVYTFIIGEPFMLSVQCCIIASIFTLASVLVDDRNGFSFLMTMPVDAKTYILEKNLFTWILLALFWLVSRVLLAISAFVFSEGAYSFGEMLSSGYGCFLAAAVATSLFLTLMLKWGPNSLILAVTLILMLSSVFLLVIILSGGLGMQSAFHQLDKLIDRMKEVSPAVIAAVSVLVTVALTAVFVRLGIRVMNNKEF